MQQRLTMSETLGMYARCFGAALTNIKQTGAVVPSQRFLINRMIACVPPSYKGRIIELGAGSGALTLRLGARCPKARILACEINPTLAGDIEDLMANAGMSRRLEVATQSAQTLLTELCAKGGDKADFIISGIPLANFKREEVVELISLIKHTLRPGGLYVQFQYSLVDRRTIKETFGNIRVVPILLNIPPAVVYYARK